MAAGSEFAGHEPLDAACPLLPKPPRDVPEPWLLDEPEDEDDPEDDEPPTFPEDDPLVRPTGVDR
jgi:hypothetical protein